MPPALQIGRRTVVRAAAVACLAVGILDVTAGAGIAGQLTSGREKASLFPSQPVLPGESRTGQLIIAAPSVDATPYLRAIHLHQRCGAVACPASLPSLADAMVLTATGPGGATWHGSMASLAGGVALPGGMLVRGHTRRYTLTLSLPAGTANAYQGLVVSGKIEWGSEDAAGNPVNKPGVGVLGESVRRGPVDQAQPDGLPFTGFDAALSLVAGLALVGVGSVVIGLARRPQHRRP